MIVLSGASASGKTEVAKYLAKNYGITKVITTTTRSMRANEIDGVDYFFVSKEKFLELINQDRFVEYTEYNGNYYGSTKDQIAKDKCIVIDPVGLKAYEDLHDPTIIIFFLNCSEQTRYERMISRGDDKEKAKDRLINDRTAFADKNIVGVDYYIDSEHNSIEQVSACVVDTYLERMKQLESK